MKNYKLKSGKVLLYEGEIGLDEEKLFNELDEQGLLEPILKIIGFQEHDLDLPDNHEEVIICPKCGESQTATVLHTKPWYCYVHECKKCSYIILESEWNKVEKLPEHRENSNDRTGELCEGEKNDSDL